MTWTNLILTLLAAVALLLSILATIIGTKLGRPMHPEGQELTDKGGVPTLFLPGYFGNRFSFGFLLRRLVKRYHADKSLIIIVKKSGELKMIGQISPKRCVIQILYEDKRARPKKQAGWLDEICRTLYHRYNVHEVNLVGHSMGCITIFWYLTHQNRQAKMTIKHVVAIAGPFNDSEVARNTDSVDAVPLTVNGPISQAPVYVALAKNISALPKTIQVLNIAGRISDSQEDDGIVSLNSAFSLRYLLRRPANLYRELIVEGRQGRHRLLHENTIVDKNIADFIWDH